MKWLSYYSDRGLSTEDEAFEYLVSSFRHGVTDWQYFVNWDKAFANLREVEVTLNTLNYLLAKDNFDAEFRYLANQHPEIINVIPILIVRDGNKSSTFNVLTVDKVKLKEESFFFGKKTFDQEDIENALLFVKNSGLIRIFQKQGVKNLADYVLGVEAGLGSNGRKNRAGKAMENLCSSLLSNSNYHYIAQVSALDIEKAFGQKLTNCHGRRFDFAAVCQDKLYIIEVNCFSGGGSKLDKTASDFISLQNDLRGQATFIWVTEGYGWKKTKNPLRKTFHHNDYVINIEMMSNGILSQIIV